MDAEKQDKEFLKVMEELALEEKFIMNKNLKLIRGLGEFAIEYFDTLLEDCIWIGEIKIVDSPKGQKQNDDEDEYFREIHVDQNGGGMTGDDYNGCIYALTKLGWIQIPYSC